MNKNLILRLVTLILLIVNMSFIFGFSSEKASASTKTSKKVTETILEITVSGFREKPRSEQKKLISKTDSIVRTLAHFSEYTLLGFLFALHFSFYNLKTIKKAFLAVAGCLIYAITDEIHQIYVPGRSFQFSDLLVDTSGGVLGVMVLLIFALIIKKCIKKTAVS